LLRAGFLLAGPYGELAVDEGCASADRADQVGCVHGAAAILGWLDEIGRMAS